MCVFVPVGTEDKSTCHSLGSTYLGCLIWGLDVALFCFEIGSFPDLKLSKQARLDRPRVSISTSQDWDYNCTASFLGVLHRLWESNSGLPTFTE